mgnify:CR=1 FL=1
MVHARSVVGKQITSDAAAGRHDCGRPGIAPTAFHGEVPMVRFGRSIAGTPVDADALDGERLAVRFESASC